MTKFSQNERLFNLLSDNQPHRTDEIVRVVYPSSNYCHYCGRGDFKNLARVGARIADLKDGSWRGKVECLIRGWKQKRTPFYWYQMDEPRMAFSDPLPDGLASLASSLPPAFPLKQKQTNQQLL